MATMRFEEVRVLLGQLKRYGREMKKKGSPWFEPDRERRREITDAIENLAVTLDDYPQPAQNIHDEERYRSERKD